MPALINMPRAAWKRQPDVRTMTVSPYWQSRSLLSVFVSGGGGLILDVANRKIYSSSSISQVITQEGRALKFSNKVTITDFKQMSTANGLTTLTWINPANATESVFCQRTSNGQNHIELRTVVGNVITFRANTDEGGTQPSENNVSVSLTLDGRYYVVIGRSRPLIKENELFVDGTFLGDFRYSGEAVASTFTLGGLPDSTAIPYTQSMRVAAFFDTDLNSAEIVELSRNPWQLFAPAPSRFYLIPTTTALPTLSSPTAINITSGGFQPRVTATY